MREGRLKIAVFVDFDNIEIGVKTTLNATFDIGSILEAIKERGEVVTKIAYGDWTRAGDYSRLLTQHAIKMVQRNLTPGGDKNGADINLALDALEMALTHDHIDAYVIVGGDSDFLSLVEKLKQYDKMVFVVGGRAFTSVILQRNCHEFIAYENLIGQGPRRQPERGKSSQVMAQALPLVRRALKVLSEREVTPQLGLLKSTLLQLDSTFSEKNYGASSFRDFAEKLEKAGALRLNRAGRNLLVESRDTDGDDEPAAAPAVEEREQRGRERDGEEGRERERDRDRDRERRRERDQERERERERPREAEPERADSREPEVQAAAAPLPPGEALAAQQAEAVGLLRRVIENAATPLRWPMYVRNVKQLMRAAEAGFDERRYGFGGILDLLRGAQRDNILRLERDRQGVLRVFPGAALQRPSPGAPEAASEPVLDAEPVEAPDLETADAEVPATAGTEMTPSQVEAEEAAAAAPADQDATVEAESVEPVEAGEPGAAEPPVEVIDAEEQPEAPRTRRRRSPGTRTGGTRTAATRTTGTRAAGARKTAPARKTAGASGAGAPRPGTRRGRAPKGNGNKE